MQILVALRKESVDRNSIPLCYHPALFQSLSARRAWIEMSSRVSPLSKSSWSLSARRAWIEITADLTDVQ